MISVKCTETNCSHDGVVYDMCGTPDDIFCGGCGTNLEPYDERPDNDICHGVGSWP